MLKSSRRLLLLGLFLVLADLLPAAEPVRKDAFGDPLPPGAIARLGTSRFRLGGPPRSLDLAPDGQSYVVEQGGDLYLFSTKTGQLLRCWEAPDKDLKEDYDGASFTPDGRFLLASMREQSWPVVFDVATGKRMAAISGKDPEALGGQLVFSADRKRIATRKRKGNGPLVVAVMEYPSCEVLLSEKLAGLESCNLALSRDGKRLAVWAGTPHGQQEERSLRLWDVETSKEIRRVVPETGSIEAAAFSPDGLQLAVASESRIHVWEVKSGKLVKRYLSGTSKPAVFCYLPDGNLLLADAAGVIRSWNTTTGERRILRGPAASGGVSRLLSDGKVLGGRIQDVAVVLWDVATGKELTPQGIHTDSIDNLCFGEDGLSLLSVARDGVRWWDLRGLSDGSGAIGERSRKHLVLPREEIVRPNQSTGTLALADNRLLRSVPGGVEVIDPTPGSAMRVFPGLSRAGMISSADGKTLVMQGWGQDKQQRSERLVVWDVHTGRKFQSVPTPSADVCAASISANRQVLSVVAYGPRRWAPHPSRLTPLGWDYPGGRLVTAGIGNEKDNTTELLFWDLAAGKEKARQSLGQSYFTAQALSPDGRRLALTESQSRSVRLWDVELNRACEPWNGLPPSYLTRLLFSPDGRMLVAACAYEHRTVVWEVATGTIRHDWTAPRFYPNALAFSAQSRYLAVGSCDSSILLYDLSGLPRPGQRQKHHSAEQLQQFWTDLQAPAPPLRGRPCWPCLRRRNRPSPC